MYTVLLGGSLRSLQFSVALRQGQAAPVAPVAAAAVAWWYIPTLQVIGDWICIPPIVHFTTLTGTAYTYMYGPAPIYVYVWSFLPNN